MSGRERWGLASALALLLLAAPAPRAHADEACARQVFAALDVARELRGVAAAATASLAASARGLPTDDAALLRRVVAAGFDPARLEARAQHELGARCAGAQADAALAWLARDDVRALLARGRRSASSQPADAAPDAEPASAERDRLLRRFDRHLGRQARAEQLAALVLGAMLRVANGSLPAPQRYTAAELDELLAAQRSRAALRTEAADALRARYAGIANRELQAALDFLSGPAGRWLGRELDAALARAMVGAAEATGAELVERLGPRAPAAPLRTARAIRL